MKLSEQISQMGHMLRYMFSTPYREREEKLIQLQYIAGTGIDYKLALKLIDEQHFKIDWVIECAKDGMIPWVYYYGQYMLRLAQENITSFEMLYEVMKVCYYNGFGYLHSEILSVMERFAILTVYGYSQVELFEWVKRGDDLSLLFNVRAKGNTTDESMQAILERYYKD